MLICLECVFHAIVVITRQHCKLPRSPSLKPHPQCYTTISYAVHSKVNLGTHPRHEGYGAFPSQDLGLLCIWYRKRVS